MEHSLTEDWSSQRDAFLPEHVCTKSSSPSSLISSNDAVHEDHQQAVDSVPLQPISTLIFVDLEATGLRSSTTKVRIMEVSLVAVSAADFVDMEKRYQYSQPEARVLNKLTICVNPLSLVPHTVSNLTKLDNFNLEHQKAFDANAGQLIAAFIRHQTRPVCMVSHNGNYYDFPLLRAELDRVQVCLDNDVLAVDSLPLLRQIWPLQEPDRNDKCPQTSSLNEDSCHDRSKEGLPARISPDQERTPPDDDSFHGVCYASPPLKKIKKAEAGLSHHQPQVPWSPEALQEVSHMLDVESTPERPLISLLSRPPRAPCRASDPPVHYDHWQVNRVRKKLDFCSDSGQASSTEGLCSLGAQAPPATTPSSYSLGNLHKYLFGQLPKTSHGAEADCLSLMRVCSFSAQKFVDLARKEASAFHCIQKMW